MGGVLFGIGMADLPLEGDAALHQLDRLPQIALVLVGEAQLQQPEASLRRSLVSRTMARQKNSTSPEE